MKKQHLKLSAADRKKLNALLSKGELKAREFKRATGLLELDRGRSFTDVSQTLGVSDQTVSRWCTRYKAKGLEQPF
jgi:transposase